MMRMRLRLAVLWLGAWALSGCALGPQFDTRQVDSTLTPANAIARGAAATGAEVLWGGVIVQSTNLREATQLEVLGYPLDDVQRPDRDDAAQGRFLVLRAGYLESVDFAPGRMVTVIGRLAQPRSGQIGAARYTYPVVEARGLHLWPEAGARSEPSVHFGIGVMFHN